jgi:hypothetical protein
MHAAGGLDHARLSPATLGAVRPGCGLPGCDRVALQSGIVHLELGAFRARASGNLYR